jgi:predicted Zn-dependent protease
MLKKLPLALLLLALGAGAAFAHGDISNLPDSVQIMQYQMLLYMDTENTETRNSLAMAYFRTGQFDLAAQELQHILTKDADNFNALDGMGLVLLRQNKTKEALKYLERARAVNAKDVMLHVHFSFAYEQLDQADQAAASLKKAAELYSGSDAAAAIEKELKMIKGISAK